MDPKILGRVIAVLLLAIALVAVIARFSRLPEDRPAHRQQTERMPDRRAAELDRCRDLGLAAVDDPACKAAWAENRKRFFSSNAPRQVAPAAKPSGKVQDRIAPVAPGRGLTSSSPDREPR